MFVAEQKSPTDQKIRDLTHLQAPDKLNFVLLYTAHACLALLINISKGLDISTPAFHQIRSDGEI